MNRLTLAVFIIFTSAITFAQKENDIIGKYRLPNKLDIEIFKNDGKYFGKIIGFENFYEGQTTDVNNPDASKRNDSLMGKVIIWGLEFDRYKKQWVDGKMYGPEKGMVFNLKITEMYENKVKVVGSKYIFWKTLIWEKI